MIRHEEQTDQNFMPPFIPTHRIVLPSGREFEVYLNEGAAYTYEEWMSETAADFECTEDGDWLFQGQAFSGEIFPI
jgi:hypothetical protein